MDTTLLRNIIDAAEIIFWVANLLLFRNWWREREKEKRQMHDIFNRPPTTPTRGRRCTICNEPVAAAATVHAECHDRQHAAKAEPQPTAPPQKKPPRRRRTPNHG